MIQSLLIANRGEIACRIIRTARALGIRTVAVYSDADADALHARLADEAVHIGPSPARESYLVGERIIAAARETGAEAIHPGYGFLSENADFAQAVLDAGLVWVGPNPDSIRAMGLKDAAKGRMIAAGVPVTPGYLGADQSPERLRAEADAIGYPVLIKAVAGGGGKGMRQVGDAAAELQVGLVAVGRDRGLQQVHQLRRIGMRLAVVALAIEAADRQRRDGRGSWLRLLWVSAVLAVAQVVAADEARHELPDLVLVVHRVPERKKCQVPGAEWHPALPSSRRGARAPSRSLRRWPSRTS